MRKIIKLLLLLPLLAMINGCSKDDIIFDHEREQFEIKENAILLEVILPSSSQADDTYYIVGEFNGGAEVAIGNPEWQLTKAENSDAKWGIYLVPETFVNDKDLSDGYYFHSVSQGDERSINNQAVLHTLDNARVGTRTNVWVDRWAAYFEGGGEGEKDYGTVYVDNQAGWTDLALYAWAGDGDVDGGWPGWSPNGTQTIEGISFTYFNIDKQFNGLNVNLIVNGSGGQTSDINATLGQDIYIRLFADGSYEILDPDNLAMAYRGYTIYVDDSQADFIASHLYAYGSGAGSPSWGGWQYVGEREVNDVNYKYFEPGEDLNNRTINLIFNDNSADGQTSNKPQVTLDGDYYFRITGDVAVEIDPYETDLESRTIYVEDLTGWSDITLHYYDGQGLSTAWPGVAPDGTETIGTVTYKYFTLPEELDGMTLQFIFNNNGAGTQLDEFEVVLEKDHYLVVTTTGVEDKVFRVYADNQTGWPEVALYGWGGATTPSWPGLQPSGTRIINGVTYTYFEMPTYMNGLHSNLIFNNNGNGTQLSDFGALINRDYYVQIMDGVTEVTP